MPREWRELPGYDPDNGQDEDEMDAYDIEACRRHCEIRGFGGFIVFEGGAYFRKAAAVRLSEKRQKLEAQADSKYDKRVTLHLGFIIPPLRAREGGFATVGSSEDLWLEDSDFIFGFVDRHVVGFGTQDLRILTSHGFPRGWPEVYRTNSVLKKLVNKKGPLAPVKRSKKTKRPNEEYELLLDGIEQDLLPLQSFGNARSVERETGMSVVEGWAVYELFDYDGAAFMAERYWWNTDEDGEWLDFTPRPKGFEALLLVESGQSYHKQPQMLSQRHTSIAEALLRLRSFPGKVISPLQLEQKAEDLDQHKTPDLSAEQESAISSTQSLSEEQAADAKLNQDEEESNQDARGVSWLVLRSKGLDTKDTDGNLPDTDDNTPKSTCKGGWTDDEATDACAKDIGVQSSHKAVPALKEGAQDRRTSAASDSTRRSSYTSSEAFTSSEEEQRQYEERQREEARLLEEARCREEEERQLEEQRRKEEEEEEAQRLAEQEEAAAKLLQAEAAAKAAEEAEAKKREVEALQAAKEAKQAAKEAKQRELQAAKEAKQRELQAAKEAKQRELEAQAAQERQRELEALEAAKAKQRELEALEAAKAKQRELEALEAAKAAMTGIARVEALCTQLCKEADSCAVQELASLIRGSQEEFADCAPAGTSTDVVASLVRLLSDENFQAAADAAFVLHWILRAGHRMQLAARCANAADALAIFFTIRVAQEGSPTAADSARELWCKPVEEHASRVPRASENRSNFADQAYWERQKSFCCDTLQDMHASCSPRERRAHSWARTLSFAKLQLGLQPQSKLRVGTKKHPFVIWVVGAEDQVEVELAIGGFFKDANFIDRNATEIILFGHGLRVLNSVTHSQDGEMLSVRTADYRAAPFMSQIGAMPDLIAALMPAVKEGARDAPADAVLQEAVAVMPSVPVVISTRFCLGEGKGLTLRHKLQGQVMLPPTRCVFSAAAGKPNLQYDDNGWIFVVKDPAAMAKALQLNLTPVLAPRNEGVSKMSTIFWGILDIKYDTAEPVLERVKVLETGDGKSSKFSGDGAAILQTFHEHYRWEEDSDLKMDQILAADKKLTHDFMAAAGYEHLVPQQVCFPRFYEPDLADKIARDLGVGQDDCVVLKLCNRSRAAGVIVVPVVDLDKTLQQLLRIPEDPDSWFQEQLRQSMVLELGSRSGTHEEQVRHWWSNESPVFVVERWCKSVPVASAEGKIFDGTLRVGFAVRRQGKRKKESLASKKAALVSQMELSHPNSIVPRSKDCGECKSMGTVQSAIVEDENPITPEQLEIDWLGGYWKLPKSDMQSDANLRDRVVSAARTSGTAPVNRTHLFEVYAGLGDSVQQMFGAAEPNSTELAQCYHPELAAYLLARLGTTRMTRDMFGARRMVHASEDLVVDLEDSPMKSCVMSFTKRAQGVMEARMRGPGCWKEIEYLFQTSLGLLPTNANALFCLGMGRVQGGQTEEAEALLNRALLLDPDFKAPYVMLGIVYLRLGIWQLAIQYSEACLGRHPESPQCEYHIAIANCQIAIQIKAHKGDEAAYKKCQTRALEGMQKARASSDAKRRVGGRVKDAEWNPCRQLEAPWQVIDDAIIAAMEAEEPPPTLELPSTIGWTFSQWRM